MKRNTLFILVVSLVLLTGCQLREDAASLYKEENPLEAEISVPDDLVKGGSAAITVTLTQNGQPVKDPDFIHMNWTRPDGTSVGMRSMRNLKDGSYRSEQSLEFDGLYFLKVHASNEGSTITPTRQVVVGQLTPEDIQYLQEQAPADIKNHEGHH
ncbi:hypothetical protein GLW04_03520 [Halobacillus litoralis]|uniref:YtkA-like domain-containing protein n=1 Tax=Halobacillus litoralis TaxID=45668 RepID=A0A845DZT0_9BACI|nr:MULTISPECIES: FixH family protein [Halobacillus]MYL18944.1 hypothetical protein [Halobacillus litoralis]MYL31115.1 hypothetical protein [Halobacillus halophilus]MYL39424.1 hypothetical protein [Halobacillus litoralis]